MIGYRKLVASGVAVLLSTSLLALHLLNGDQWVTFNTFQLGFFFGTNAVAKLWGRGSERSPKTPA
jgi:hypothetical protein